MKKKVGKLQLSRETLRRLDDKALAGVGAGAAAGSVVNTDCGTCAADCPTGVNGTCSCGQQSCNICIDAGTAGHPKA
jgi:hypothetical protein